MDNPLKTLLIGLPQNQKPILWGLHYLRVNPFERVTLFNVKPFWKGFKTLLKGF